jgi:hypothetical protein
MGESRLGRLKGVAMKAGQQLAMVASHMDLPEDIQKTLEKLLLLTRCSKSRKR